jgi:ABC-type oligopeptide transport system ATPase subunit
MIVVGPSGAGKTTLGKHVTNKMGGGAIFVSIDDTSGTIDVLVAAVLWAALEHRAPNIRYLYYISPLKEGGKLLSSTNRQSPSCCASCSLMENPDRV